jgi:hypothetical protein
MKLRGSIVFSLLTVILSISWATSSGLINLSISTPNPTQGGGVAVVTPVNQAVYTAWGKSQKISGVTVFDVSGIAAGMANSMRIHVVITNPEDMSKVFGNPHTYINVTVSDSYSSAGNVYAWGILSKSIGEVFLWPQGVPGGTVKLYIQVSVTVPGGPPSGQQEKTGLTYYCKVDPA